MEYLRTRTPLKLSMQFFAEDDGNDYSDDGANTDAADNDDFFSGLFDDEDGEQDGASDDADTDTNTNEDADSGGTEGLQNDDNADSGDEQKYQVKYNGEFQELPLSELIKNAQKGMNYDKVLSERDSLKASKQFSIIDKLAQQNNLSVDEYLNLVEQNIEKAEIEKNVTDEIPFEVAKQITQLKRENELYRQKEAQSNAELKQRQEYLDLIKVYPNAGASEIPIEVVRDVASGMSLMSAYTKYENTQLKTQLSALQTNQNNKKKALGSLSNDAGSTNSGGMTSIIDSVFN